MSVPGGPNAEYRALRRVELARPAAHASGVREVAIVTRAGTDLNTGEPFNPVAGLAEGAFQQAVANLARACGWRVAHFRPVRVQRQDGSTYHETPVALDAKGWPDLVLARGSKVLVRELKDEKGDLKPEQVAWLEALAAGGLDVGVWRPSDWPEIDAVLTGAQHYRTRFELAEGLLAEAVSAQALDSNPKTRAWLYLWRQRVRAPFAYTRPTRRPRAAARPAKSSKGEE